MLAFDPKKRITIKDIKTHKWFKHKILEENDLITHLKFNHRKVEQKRQKDVKKMKDLIDNLDENRDVQF